MTCMCEATMDDLIHTFIQIANSRSWLKEGSIGKGLDSPSLKLKIASRCGDPKILVDGMKFFHGAKDLMSRYCGLKGLELFGSTKRKLDLPPGVDCESHQLVKVNYSIPCPKGHAKRACIEEALNSRCHGVAHTTSIFETYCIIS